MASSFGGSFVRTQRTWVWGTEDLWGSHVVTFARGEHGIQEQALNYDALTIREEMGCIDLRLCEL